MMRIRRERKSLCYGTVEGSTSEVPLQNDKYKGELCDAVFKIFINFCNVASILSRRPQGAELINFTQDYYETYI